MGFFEIFMNILSYYWVYYGINLRYFDVNYVGIFIIWDKMFGIFVFEVEEDLVEYGIIKWLGMFNFFRIVFYEWIDIGKDVWLFKSIGEVMSYIFWVLGWSFDGLCRMVVEFKVEWKV